MPETIDTNMGTSQVFMYMDEWPHATGSGHHLRFHSNTAAWVDLGWDVTVVRVTEKPTPPPDWPGVRMEQVVSDGPSATLAGKLQYRLGWVGQAGCAFYFGKHRAMLEAVKERQRRAPRALHQLEDYTLGNVTPFLPGLNAVFSHHDLAAEAFGAVSRISADLDRRGPTPAETREIRFVAAAEERICRASRLILCISDHDRQVLQERFGLRHAVYFPMSVTPEQPVVRTAGDGQTLRIAHVGRVSHLPTYRSLEQILGEVFPRLQPETLDHLQLRVAGKLDEGHPRCQRILALAEPFRKQVVFTGFVDDLGAEYARADLQVVASTEASGLRTRIVESMAWGIPVLSTTVAARGIAGLDPGRNILLADKPEEFAAELDRLAKARNRLLAISAGGIELYRTRNSRRAVAAQLEKLLADFYSL